MFDFVWKISFRLPAIVIFAAACAAVAIGVYSYRESSKEVRTQATQKLVALRESRHAALSQYFRSIDEDLELLAANAQVIDALTDFRRAFGQLDQAKRYLEEQALRRIFSPATPEGNRDVLTSIRSPGAVGYFHTHNDHHAWFQVATKLKGYYDLFLIAPTGEVLYSVFKEPDFATNLNTGAWAETGLAGAFRKALSADAADETAFVDFQRYEPSGNAPAAFVARRVIDKGRVIGVLAMQMPIGRLNEVMQVTAGMGTSGETYVVGSGFLMHSDSRFSETSSILATEVRTRSVERALNGESGVLIVDDYRGIPVLSAFQPFVFHGATWALLAEKDMAEIQMPIEEMRESIVLIGFGLTLFVAVIGLVLSTSITLPLARLNRSIKEFRETRQAVDLTGFSDRDEIGEIAQGFHAASRDVSDYINSINEAREELKQGEQEILEREERIRSLLRVSPIGFCLVRFSGEVLLTNRAFKKIIGQPETHSGTIDVAGLYRNPDDRNRYVEILKRDGEISGFEVEWELADGSPVWVILSSKVIDYDGGDAIMAWIDDITERKLAEAEVAKQKAILEVTLETMDQGITMMDGDLTMLALNTKFRELLEFPTDGFPTGTPLEDFFRYNAERGEYGEGDTEEQVRSRVDLARKFEAHHFERTRPDGTVIEIRGNPLPDDQGFVTTYTDITEHKRAEEEIAAKEALLRLSFNTMTDGIYVLDKDLSFVLFNDRYVEMVDLPAGSIEVGEPVARAIRAHADRGDYGDGIAEDLIADRLENLASPDFIQSEMAIDGGRRIIDLRKAAIEGGGAVIVTTDITERKRAEQEIAAKEAQLRLTLDNMPGAMFLVDRDLNIVLVNDTYKTYYGDPNGLVAPGASIRDILKDEIARGVLTGDGTPDDILRARIDSYLGRETLTFEDKSSDGRYIQLTRTPAPDGHTVSVAVDITERKRAEQELAQAFEFISSSIEYASKIQRALLPPDEFLAEGLADHFVIWEPRDVVGGDIYWFRRIDDGCLVVLTDCTGHGVPGAFMTMIATGALDRALREHPDGDPAMLLHYFNRSVKRWLGQDQEGGESDDGMEIGVCRLTKKGRKRRVTFAGARFSLFHADGETVDEIKGDKSGIGYRRVPLTQVFTNQVIEVGTQSAFYLASDGLTDQVGGKKNRMFGKRRFVQLLEDVHGAPMAEQKRRLVGAFTAYQGDQARRDDLSIIGFTCG